MRKGFGSIFFCALLWGSGESVQRELTGLDASANPQAMAGTTSRGIDFNRGPLLISKTFLPDSTDWILGQPVQVIYRLHNSGTL